MAANGATITLQVCVCEHVLHLFDHVTAVYSVPHLYNLRTFQYRHLNTVN